MPCSIGWLRSMSGPRSGIRFTAGLGRDRPPRPDPPQRDRGDAHPDDVQRGRRQRAVPPAVDDEAGCAEKIHPLEGRRAAGHPADCDQEISEQDQSRAGPADDLDEDQLRAQAARFLSTYWRMPPWRKYSSSLAVSIRTRAVKPLVVPSGLATLTSISLRGVRSAMPVTVKVSSPSNAGPRRRTAAAARPCPPGSDGWWAYKSR